MTITDQNLSAAVDAALDVLDDDASTTRPAPYVTALPAATLFADRTYQRDLDDARVQKMIDDFDSTLLGVIEVSDRANGTYAILDGQHRLAAAVEAHPDRGGAHLVCQVHRGLSVEDEARTFYEIDVRRKPLSGWDRWKARRGSGDQTVMTIERIVTENGLRIDPAPRDGHIHATRALEVIFSDGGEELLTLTLTVLIAGYGRVREANDGDIMRGIALLLRSYDREELDLARLAAQLQTMPPRQVKARAHTLKEAHRAELPRLIAAVMIDRYNAGGGRRIEDLLSRAPASSRLSGSQSRRSRDLAAIRRWAVRNGFAVVDKARIPAQVIAAYIETHPGFELSAS